MKEKKNQTERDPMEKRLDALIRLNCEILLGNKIGKSELIQSLNSVGLTPLEIAKIMGKSSASDMSPFLYSNKNKKSSNKKEISNNDKAEE